MIRSQETITHAAAAARQSTSQTLLTAIACHCCVACRSVDVAGCCCFGYNFPCVAVADAKADCEKTNENRNATKTKPSDDPNTIFINSIIDYRGTNESAPVRSLARSLFFAHSYVHLMWYASVVLLQQQTLCWERATCDYEHVRNRSTNRLCFAPHRRCIATNST